MPYNHLILCHPLLLLPSIFSIIRVFSNESVLHIRLQEYWSFSFNPSNEYSELVSFRIDGFDVLTVQENLKSLQPHISKALILRHSVLLMVQVSHPYMMTGKSIGLNIEMFVSQVMSLIFNTLSRFVLSLLPRSKHLNFITAVTIRSDFGALKIKVCHCFPICLP